MKIAVGQLRSVIKEEISRVLSEADAPQFSGIAGSWFGLMKRSSNDPELLQSLADAWDAMSAAGVVSPADVRDVSDKVAERFGLSSNAISFHLRKNPSASGVSGQDLLKAAQMAGTTEKARQEASMAKSATEREAIAAAKDQLGIDLATMSFIAQQSDDPGAYRREMSQHDALKSKIIAAWDPVLKKFDKSKL